MTCNNIFTYIGKFKELQYCEFIINIFNIFTVKIIPIITELIKNLMKTSQIF